jgi:hypothetical protein
MLVMAAILSDCGAEGSAKGLGLRKIRRRLRAWRRSGRAAAGDFGGDPCAAESQCPDDVVDFVEHL